MNKALKWKFLVTLVLVALAIWKVYPPKKKIKLGLDLKGGMHLVLQVDMLKYFEIKAKNVDDKFQRYLDKVKTRVTTTQENLFTVLEEVADEMGTNLSQYFPDYLKEGEKYKTNEQIIMEFKEDVLTAPLKAEEIIRKRVDGLGVAEPVIHTEGWNRIVVQLPGIKNRQRAKNIIGKTALLEFKLVSDDREKLLEAIKGKLPLGYEVLYDREGRSYLVKRRAELTGDSLKEAYPGLGRLGEPVVHFILNRKGANIFAAVTQENVNRRLAIVLDGEVLMAPVIRQPIPDGKGIIEGKFTETEVQDIANVLNAGALPAPLHIIEDRTVSPLLGKDSVRKGILAGVSGFILVILFMAVYYLSTGLIADFAVCLNILFVFAALAWFGATLTLPGIAGIILTIGMAVDANVLINERIREELALGKRITAAIIAGYDKAFATILDANLTTLFGALVLFIFGYGPVRGFAVTLSIGIIASMFTAVYVTRFILEFLVGKGIIKKIKMFQLFKKTNIKFLNYRRIAYIISVTVIVVGIVMGFNKGKEILGIDFTGGQLLQLRFQKPVDIATIRKALIPAGLQNSYIQGFGTQKDYLIKTEKGSVETIEQQLRKELSENPFDVLRVEDVGPVVSTRLRRQALIALSLALLAMIVYITYRFEFKFAISGIIAIIHDVLVCLAMCIIFNRQFSLPIIAAVMAVIGYSINDTIVIFDRIRELRKLMPKTAFTEIVNTSINQTFSRTLLTSLTTLIVVLTLYLFGGEVINDFAFVMLVGIISGTYSTIFVASSLAAEWHKE